MWIPLPVLSWGYRREREKVKKEVFAYQDSKGIPRDLEAVIQIGDEKLRKLDHSWFNYPIPDGISSSMYDMNFMSPLTLSAFKGEIDIICRWMDLGLGAATTKTIMQNDREGNPRPRIQDITVDGLDCLINAMGLPGEGVNKKLKAIDDSPIFAKHKPVGLSVGGSSVEEYKYVFDSLNDYVKVKELQNVYFEVNISCPNTHEGQNMAKNPHLLEELLYYMRSKTDRIIGVKLSPDMNDNELLKFAHLVSRVDRTYLNLGNTTFKTCLQVNLPESAISKGGGGMSGPHLYPRTLEMVKCVRKEYDKEKLPIIATGGVNTTNKVIQLLDFGANLVGMATAVVKDMYCIPRINRELAKRRGIN